MEERRQRMNSCHRGIKAIWNEKKKLNSRSVQESEYLNRIENTLLKKRLNR